MTLLEQFSFVLRIVALGCVIIKIFLKLQLAYWDEDDVRDVFNYLVIYVILIVDFLIKW